MNVGLERVPQCMICGTEGPWLHRDLRDPRYGVRGRYHFRRCPRCSLVWLDPRPDPASIALCYQQYYTHITEPFGSYFPERRRFRHLRDSIRLPFFAAISVTATVTAAMACAALAFC